MSESVIEEYRKTLEALHQLRCKYVRMMDLKRLRVIDEEIDEVSRTIAHLEKGDKRWKWDCSQEHS